MLDLRNIIDFQGRGDGDMGSLTFGVTVGGTEDTNDKARFCVPNRRFAFSSIRVHFVGGSGANDLILNVDHGLGPAYDFALHTIEDAGTDNGDVHFRVFRDEREHWIFDGRRDVPDVLVPTWTNPNSPNMKWGITVFFELINEGGGQ